MATNKEKIYKHIQQIFLADQKNGEDNGIDTAEATAFLKIKRPNASALLNKLVKEGLLSKTKTRPVRYHLSEKVTQDAFTELIGKNGSLSQAVEKAKAAMLYPSGMLPIQIVATPGSGTSFFTKVSIQYAKDKGLLTQDAPFHEINCLAEKNNPEKLNDLLFGKTETDNFLDRYQTSIIMVNHYEKLDEVQVYRINHLLDNYQNNKHNVIIFSTTPDNKNRIKTSIEIDLPTFDSRPLAEKIAVVANLFKRQAKNSKKSILVDSHIVLSLATHQYHHGFKDIEKDITLACAKAYLRSLNDQQTQEYIGKSDFSNDFIFNKTLDINQAQKFNQLIGDRKNFVFTGNNLGQLADYVQKYNHDLYRNINRNYQNLSSQGVQPAIIQKAVYQRIKYLFEKYGFHVSNKIAYQNKLQINELSKIVPKKLIALTHNFIEKSAQTLHHNFDQNIFYGLCLHLNSIIILGNKSNTDLDEKQIAALKLRYPHELQLTRDFARKLTTTFDYHFTELELISCLSFLVEPQQTTNQSRPVVLFALHGSGAAHQISAVVNMLNHSSNTFAYDMELDKDLKQVYQELKKLVLKINQGAGIIVIYDMGSFKDLFERIMDQTGIPIRLINIPITLIGLETARKAMVSPNIDDVYHNIASNLNNYETRQNRKDKPNMIITLCHTGEGGAVQLKDYIDQYSQLDWIVKPMSISNREELAKRVINWRKIYNIKEFIGTYDPNLFGIPFIPISKVFENSHKNLDKVLTFVPINSEAAIFKQVYEYYQHELKYVNVDKLKENMPQVMEMLTEQYHLNQDLQLGVFTHIVGILESGIGGKKRENIKISPEIRKNLALDFQYVRQSLKILEKKFDFVFNDSDIYTIIAIIKQI